MNSGDSSKNERVLEPNNGPKFVAETNFAIRQYAAEIGSFVLSAGGYQLAENISDEWKEPIPSIQADWANGGSAIVAPGGQYLVELVINEERILYAELDLNLIFRTSITHW